MSNETLEVAAHLVSDWLIRVQRIPKHIKNEELSFEDLRAGAISVHIARRYLQVRGHPLPLQMLAISHPFVSTYQSAALRVDLIKDFVDLCYSLALPQLGWEGIAITVNMDPADLDVQRRLIARLLHDQYSPTQDPRSVTSLFPTLWKPTQP